MHLPKTLPLALALALGACTVDPAPKDAEGAMKWLLRNGDDATDAQMLDALAKLHVAVGGQDRTERLDGVLDPLADADVEPFPLDQPQDLSKAKGFMQVNLVPCSFDGAVFQFLEADQKQLHPAYEAYTRLYGDDHADFAAGKTNRTTVTNTYQLSLLGSTYVTEIHGRIRRVPAGSTSPAGPMFVARLYIPKPAVFTGSDSDHLRLDYQVHVFWERAPGQTLHAVGFWRDVKWAGFGLEDTAFIEGTLSNLEKGDEEIGDACQ